MQPEPGWGLPSVRACARSAASVGPPAFAVGAFRQKAKGVRERGTGDTVPAQSGLQTPRGLPVLLLLPSSSEQECILPPPLLGMLWSTPGCRRAGGGCRSTRNLSSRSWCPHHPPNCPLLTLTGSGCRTGVSCATWGTGGWGTTRSIQPIIPRAAGSAEGSPAGRRPAAGVHTAQGIPAAPAAHAVSRAAQKGPWCPSVCTSCLGNTALQHSQSKPGSTPHPSPLLRANYTFCFILTISVKLAFHKGSSSVRCFIFTACPY